MSKYLLASRNSYRIELYHVIYVAVSVSTVCSRVGPTKIAIPGTGSAYVYRPTMHSQPSDGPFNRSEAAESILLMY